MCRAARSSGQAKGPTLRAGFYLSGILLLLVVQTNCQELPGSIESMNKIIMTLKENMEDMKNQMQTSLKGMKEELQIIKKFINMPVTGKENFENITCPEFFIKMNTTGECFLIGTKQLSYKAASDMCKSIGAYLAVPNDLKSIGLFLDRREYGPSHQDLWIGLSDQLTPNIWRWTDGTLVDALTLHYNLNGLNRINHTYTIGYTTYVQDHPTKPGYNCGILSSKSNHMEPLEYNLETRRCDLVEKPFLCEIEPPSIPIDIDLSPVLCPEGFLNFDGTGGCVYISTPDESTSYFEAQKLCSSQYFRARLAYPRARIEDLSNFLHKQNLVGDPSFYLNVEFLNVYPHVFSSWNDTAPDILRVDDSSGGYMGSAFWLSTGYCPLLRARPNTFDWYSSDGEVDDCSSSHRFVCLSWA